MAETTTFNVPPRRVIASYTSYEEAQAAVDKLSDEGFPVEHVAIVAEGLRFVEQITGRISWGRAALGGAASGATTGLLIGFIFGLLSLFDPLTNAMFLALWGLGVGAVIGLLLGLGTYALTGGRRDFSSVSGMQADRYNIQVDTDHATKAEHVLGLTPSGIDEEPAETVEPRAY
jgi:hypothetical protein